MKLTPLDIKKQEFTRAFRGVDPQEVQAFLQMVADQWSNLLDENARMEQKVRDLDSKLEHYRKIEEALQEALETARDNSHKTIENAQREAQIIIREARSEAEEIRKKGSQEHKRLKHDITKVSGRRDEVIARLRAFLMSEMELLARFEGQDHISSGYVSLHSSSRKQLESRSYNDDLPDDNFTMRASSSRGSFDEAPSYEVDIPLNEDRGYEVNAVQHEPKPAAKRPDAEITLDDLAPKQESETDDGSLSSDEIDFIKSTVGTSTADTQANDLFKPNSVKTNGHASADKSQDTYTLNDRFSRPRGTNETDASPQRNATHSGQGQRMRSVENTKDGWVIRPMMDDNKADAKGSSSTMPPQDNRRFTSQIFGTDSDEDLSATPEEIEKIRRILNDLD